MSLRVESIQKMVRHASIRTFCRKGFSFFFLFFLPPMLVGIVARPVLPVESVRGCFADARRSASICFVGECFSSPPCCRACNIKRATYYLKSALGVEEHGR